MSQQFSPHAGVLGRDTELSQIGDWLRRGVSDPPGPGGGAPLLVLAGEPGIGKTTLWTAAIRQARALGWQVLSCRPVPSDSGLPHVALADLVQPVGDAAFGGLPPPQRRALSVALLREEAGEGELDPRAVGTGLTALLAAAAEASPLLLAVDDAQWLDPASARALAFALQRLAGQRVAMLAALRTDEPGGSGGAFAVVEAAPDHRARQRLAVGPLTVAAVHQMFRQVLGFSFPRPVLVRIHRAAGGNPFYALEIAREIQRVGVPPPGQPLPVPGDHRNLALLRLRRLPQPTLGLLAAVAAMPSASASDLDLTVLAPAEEAGVAVVRPSGRVEFTHPLFGSALYSSLPEADRRRLHRDLADRTASPEERARHLALAAAGPSEAAAAELDRAADAASARGAADMAVELKELARRLTPETDRDARLRRDLELAERRYFAGDPNGARQALQPWLTALPPGDDRAQVLVELGSLHYVQGEAAEGTALMTRALGEAQTPALRARIHARVASCYEDADLVLEHIEAARALLDADENPQLYSFTLLTGAMFRLHSGRGADHAAVERGIRLQQDAAGWVMSPVPAFWARNFDDFTTARQRFEDIVRMCREQGDEAQVSGALTHLARLEAMTGHMERARALAAEALELAAQTEQETYLDMALCAQAQISAQAGDLAAARAAVSGLLERLAEHPDDLLEVPAREALGLAALTAGDPAEADRQLTRADLIEDRLHNREPANQRFHADHAEAVIALGDLERAGRLVRRLEERAAALPRPWITAVSARCRGLLNAARGDLSAALADCERALAAHEDLGMPSELGRTLLALGRLHRRRNERLRAQECLQRAVRAFESGGAAGWAAVAREELGRAQGRRGAPQRITPTERKVCELAVAGLRNAEIAAQLFLSAKTVEANLTRAYRKLGIRSRTGLAAALANAETGPAET